MQPAADLTMSVANYSQGAQSDTPLPQVAARAARQAIAGFRENSANRRRTHIEDAEITLSIGEVVARWFVIAMLMLTMAAMMTVSVRAILGSSSSHSTTSSLAAKCPDLSSCLK